MPLKRSRLSKLSFYIIIISISIFLILVLFLFIIYFYPISTISNNFNSAHYSRLVSPWPMSSLDQELLERRRLRRYAKSEQVRRMEKQLQRMENLNIPIYDLFLDNNAEIYSQRYVTSPDDTSFLWPIIPGRKIFNNLNKQEFNRKSVSVIFPHNQWTQINEGVLLLGGEEIKATIPLIKGTRSFSFNLFLLTPGSIRINIGQYVWAKTFTDDDVQKNIRLSIPINDSTATSIKIVSISSSFYLLNANVEQLEHTGRSPIRISNSSNFWLPNNTFVFTNQKSSNAKTDDEDNMVDEEETDEKLPDELKIYDSKEPNPQNTTDNSKNTQKNNLENSPDPLKQVANPQIFSNEPYTIAFGYNILYIQTPKISDLIIKNKKLFSKIAPNLSSLIEQSVVFEKNIAVSESRSENFRKFIFSDHNFLTSSNTPITKEEINGNISKNVYQELRKYGYKIVGISYPEAFYYNDKISESTEFSKIYGRWLEKNDWNFAYKNVKIDDRNLPVSGLDAIFKTNEKSIATPLSSSDFPIISQFLTNVAENIDNVPDWGANELLLINKKDLYIPRAVEAFQQWSKTKQQSRFLAHILLDTDSALIRPTIKDLGKSLTTIGVSSFLNPSKIKEFANISYIDKAIGQLIDTTTARKFEHRTIVFILIPNDNNDSNKNYATGVFKIPGLLPKKDTKYKDVTINDISATLLTNVGIPVGKNISHSSSNISGNMLEKINYNDFNSSQNNISNNKSNFTKYTMVIKPDENNCNSFYWNSKSEPILKIQSSAPVYQIISNEIIEFFPCSIKNKFVSVTWYQKSYKKPSPLNNIDDHLGGYFSYKRPDISNNLPNFYFGNNLVSSNDLVFYFDTMTENQFNSIFIVEEKNNKKCINYIKDNFFTIEKYEKTIKDPEILANKTKIGFFITPL